MVEGKGSDLVSDRRALFSPVVQGQGLLHDSTGLHAARGYWGHVMPGLGTPKVKIQVIDLEHLIEVWRAQMQSGPPPLHFLRANLYQYQVL